MIYVHLCRMRSYIDTCFVYIVDVSILKSWQMKYFHCAPNIVYACECHWIIVHYNIVIASPSCEYLFLKNRRIEDLFVCLFDGIANSYM